MAQVTKFDYDAANNLLKLQRQDLKDADAAVLERVVTTYDASATVDDAILKTARQIFGEFRVDGRP